MKRDKFFSQHALFNLLAFAILFIATPEALAQQLTPDKQQEVDALSQQMKATPNDYSLFAKRGFIYKKAGKESAANMDFEQALTLNPKWQQGYFLKANVLKEEHKPALALEQFNKAAKIEILNSSALVLRGGLNWDLKNYTDAYKDYTSAIKADPQCADAYGARAALGLELHGTNPQSIADLEQTIKLNPSDSNAKAMLKGIRDKKSTK